MVLRLDDLLEAAEQAEMLREIERQLREVGVNGLPGPDSLPSVDRAPNDEIDRQQD